MESWAIILIVAVGAVLALVIKKKKKAPGMKCGKRTDLKTTEWDSMFQLHEKHLISWLALKTTAWVESNYDPCALGTSGEVGMFQIMLWWESRYNISRDLPDDNCELAALILEYERKTWYEWEKVAASYNAGDKIVRNAVSNALDAGDRLRWKEFLPEDVRNYVIRWLATYRLLGGEV